MLDIQILGPKGPLASTLAACWEEASGWEGREGMQELFSQNPAPSERGAAGTNVLQSRTVLLKALLVLVLNYYGGGGGIQVFGGFLSTFVVDI